MKQFNVRVEDRIGQAFYHFCKDRGTTPYELLGAIVGFYGRAAIVKEGKGKTLTDEEALVEMGRIISDMQKFASANGEFLKAISALLEPYGIKLTSLWPSLRESGDGELRLQKRQPLARS